MSKYEEQKHNLSLKLKDICRPYPPLETKPPKVPQPLTAFEFHRKKTDVEEAKYVLSYYVLFFQNHSLKISIWIFSKLLCDMQIFNGFLESKIWYSNIYLVNNLSHKLIWCFVDIYIAH